MKDYMQELRNPDQKSKGLTRWWWYGVAVKKEEIIEQLDEMAANGIGGVEIQMLYPLAMDTKERKNIAYFSPEYFDILEFTKQETEKRGMIFDLTLGTSWPFGGPFVPPNLSAPHVTTYTIDVTGPKTFTYDFTTRISGEIVGCVMGKMENSEMLPETMVDLSDKLGVHELYNWPWGTMLKDVEIPEGNWKIMCLISETYREKVLGPMRDSAGAVIDHNRKDAAQLFFHEAGDPIVEHLGKGAVRSFFCDSLELEGHNWTDIMYEEFEKRRGYSLKPYIYALHGEVKGITDRVRYDYFKTYSELTIENFFQEMTDWCHKVGSKSRIQAHGTWGDALLAYGAADIPEGETFSAGDIYTVNTIHRRLASSAGHLYHKPIVSNESFTWLRFPRYTETLEHIKVAVDAIFVDGMNQIVNHGFSYNPQEENWPFFASSHICNRNTWWKFYKNIGDYIQRVSHFMQKGKTAAQVCIYLPQSDIWAENPLCDLHMCMQLRERFEDDAIDGIAKAGYWFDYINDEALGRFNEYGYKVLILMETERIPVETAQNIKKFTEAGGIVICAEHLPVRSCGLLNAEVNDAQVAQIMKELLVSGKLLLTANKREALVAQLRQAFVPDLTITEGAQDIGYIHKQTEEADIYFLSNMSKNDYTTTLRFKNLTAPTLVVDPLTLKKKSILAQADHQVTIHMEPQQSLLIFFGGEPQQIERELETSGQKDISDNWSFSVKEKQFEKTMPKLQNWQEIPELTYYCGDGVYEKQIEMTAGELENKEIWLQLEQVSVCARVYVNGQCAGDMIKYPYEIEIGQLLHAGTNTLRVEVTNLLINHSLDPEFKVDLYEEQISEGWPYFTSIVNRNRDRRLGNWREKKMIQELFPSGLCGEAKLVYKN